MEQHLTPPQGTRPATGTSLPGLYRRLVYFTDAPCPFLNYSHKIFSQYAVSLQDVSCMCRAEQSGIVLFRPEESQPNVPATADRQRAGDGAIEPHTQVEAGSFSEVARDTVVRRKVNARDGASRLMISTPIGRASPGPIACTSERRTSSSRRCFSRCLSRARSSASSGAALLTAVRRRYGLPNKN